MSVTMIAPAPSFNAYVNSTNYVSDAQGLITGVPLNDSDELRALGCELVGVLSSGSALIGRLLKVDMNATTDQAIPMFIGANVPYRVKQITFNNSPVSLTTAQGSVYNATAKGGAAFTASPTTTVFTALTGNTIAFDMTIDTVPAKTVQPGGTLLYVSLTTAQGAAATADVYIYGELYK